ncbi:hypothetical protein Tco_0213699 [Tanacetum coccineum]
MNNYDAVAVPIKVNGALKDDRTGPVLYAVQSTEIHSLRPSVLALVWGREGTVVVYQLVNQCQGENKKGVSDAYKESYDVGNDCNGVFRFGCGNEAEVGTSKCTLNMEQVKEIGEMVGVSWVLAEEEKKEGDQIEDIWGGKGYGYSQISAVGNSGGIILIWDMRVFLCKEAIGDERFIAGNLSVVALDRKLSDHCPIVLKDVDLDFRPKPFHVFNVWIDEPDFYQVVEEAWKKEKRSYEMELEAENKTLCDNERLVWLEARKREGGLNVGSLHVKNLALLGKWWWRFRKEGESMWARVIKSIHVEGVGLGDVRAMGSSWTVSLSEDVIHVVWQAVIWSTSYFIWKERNARVFGNKISSTNKIVQDIQLRSYEWIVRRSNKYKDIAIAKIGYGQSTKSGFIAIKSRIDVRVQYVQGDGLNWQLLL